MRSKAQTHKYFNLETDDVIRALFLLSAKNTHFQAPSIKNLGTQISSSESQLPPSMAGNSVGHAAEAVKNQCFHLWPIKTSLFLPIKGCTIFRFFYYQNKPTPGNTEIPLKAKQHIYLRESDPQQQLQCEETESEEIKNIIQSLQRYNHHTS